MEDAPSVLNYNPVTQIPIGGGSENNELNREANSIVMRDNVETVPKPPRGEGELNIKTSEDSGIDVLVPSSEIDYDEAIQEVNQIYQPVGIDDLPKSVRDVFKDENGKDLPSNFVVTNFDSETGLLHGVIIKDNEDLEIMEIPMAAQIELAVDPLTDIKYPINWWENAVMDTGDEVDIARMLAQSTGESKRVIIDELKNAFDTGGMEYVQEYIHSKYIPVRIEEEEQLEDEYEQLRTISPNKILSQRPPQYMKEPYETRKTIMRRMERSKEYPESSSLSGMR